MGKVLIVEYIPPRGSYLKREKLAFYYGNPEEAENVAQMYGVKFAMLCGYPRSRAMEIVLDNIPFRSLNPTTYDRTKFNEYWNMFKVHNYYLRHQIVNPYYASNQGSCPLLMRCIS
jgi:hypothetical protein